MSQHPLRRAATATMRLALVGVLVVVLAACFKIDMDLTVSEDDTVSGTMIFALQQSVIDLMGGDPDAFFDDADMAPDVEDLTTEEYTEGEFIGRQYTFSGVPLDEFSGDGSGEDLTIVRDGDVFRLSGVLDMSDAAGGDAGDMGFDPATVMSGAELNIKVTFPGEVQEANGVIDGNSVSWEPDPMGRNELSAVASAVPGGGGSSMLPIIIGILVVVAAAVAFFLLRQRRKAAPAPVNLDSVESAPVQDWSPPADTSLPASQVPEPVADTSFDAPEVPEAVADPSPDVPEAPDVVADPSPDVPEVPDVVGDAGDVAAEAGDTVADAAEEIPGAIDDAAAGDPPGASDDPPADDRI